ncbi:MAG TPA: DNA-binding response regulator, partial [Synechococcus sp. UBA9887]|nr:DNA-binding response regulator [Synechococcus sp. UBA9887]
MAAPLNDQPDRVLIVDDDPELLKLLIDTLQQAGHQCTPAADGQQALLHLRQREFELVLLDWTLPDLEGVEVLRRMRRTALNTPVLMLTARDSLEERIAALDAGADDYLTKPFELQ